MENIKTIGASKDFLLGLSLFLILLFIEKFGIEKVFVLFFLLIVFFVLKTKRVSKTLLEIVMLPVFIMSISFIGAVLYLPSAYNFIRDLVYLLSPVCAIFCGFLIVVKVKDRETIYKVLLIYCLLASVMHCYKVVFLLIDGGWDTTTIRSVGGKGSAVEAFIYALYLGYFRKKENRIFPVIFNRIFFIIVTLSIIVYFSRTTFLALILFLISIYRITQINKKQIVYLFGIITVFVSFMVSLQFMDIKRDSQGLESFLYKIKIAPSEIFNSEIDTSNKKDLWDRWRAYEVKKALDTMEEASYTPFQYIFGMGSGSLVDLDFEAPLGNELLQFIPHIHNGYAYVFFKTGLLGLFLMLVWLFYLYLFVYKKALTSEQSLIYSSISGMGLYLFFSTLVITGIYNTKPFIPLMLGLLIGLLYKIKQIENI